MTGRISVVVPVYNSKEFLPELYERLIAVLEREGQDFEIIFVDDGSKDESWSVIKELAIEDQRLRGFRLTRNYGQHNALFAGCNQATGDKIITLDDDLQNPPEEIPLLLNKLSEGFELVYGIPVVRQHNLWRRLGSRVILVSLMTVLGFHSSWRVSSYRIFDATLIDSLRENSRPRMSIDVLLSWATTEISSCSVKHEARRSGKSTYSVFKLLSHAVDVISGFSVLPLRCVALLGVGFSFVGITMLSYILGRYVLQGSTVPGFPMLATMICIFSGVQLFAVGVVGEYLGRLYEKSLGRPPYIVAESSDQDG